MGDSVFERLVADEVGGNERPTAVFVVEDVSTADGFGVQAREQEPDAHGFGRHVVDERGADRDHRANHLATLERGGGFNPLGESMSEPEVAPRGAARSRLVEHQVFVEVQDGALADVLPCFHHLLRSGARDSFRYGAPVGGNLQEGGVSLESAL